MKIMQYVLVFVTAWVFHVAFASAGEFVDPDGELPLLRMRSNFERLETLEFQCSQLIPAAADGRGERFPGFPGWEVVTKSTTVFEIRSQRSRQDLINYLNDPNKKKRMVYHVTNTYDEDTARFINQNSEVGQISHGDERANSPPIAGPLRGWGLLLMRTDEYVRGISTWDLFDRCQIERLEDNVYRFHKINGVDKARPGSYDVDFYLSPEHNYLPVRIDRRPIGDHADQVVNRIASSDFFQVDGLWFPKVVEISDYDRNSPRDHLKATYKIITDPDSVVVNPQVAADTYTLPMPENVEYVDFRVGKQFNAKPKRAHPVAVVNPNPSDAAWWLLLPVLAIVAAVGRIAWKRRFWPLSAILIFSMLCGCDSVASVPSGTERLGLLTTPDARDSLVSLEPAIIERSFESGRMVEDQFEFHVTNVSEHPIEFGNLLASCGCTSGKVEKSRLEPGQLTIVRGEVALPNFFEGKVIRLTLPIKSPHVGSVEMLLAYRPIADWKIEPLSNKVSGVTGSRQTTEFSVYSGKLGELHFHSDFPGSTIEFLPVGDRQGVLSVSVEMPDEPGFHPVDIPITCNLAPLAMELTVLRKVSSALEWKPPVIAIKNSEPNVIEAKLVIHGNVEDLKLTGDGPWQVVDESLAEQMREDGGKHSPRQFTIKLSRNPTATEEPHGWKDSSSSVFKILASGTNAAGRKSEATLSILPPESY